MDDEILYGFAEREKKPRIEPSWLKEQLLAGASVAQIANEAGYSRQGVYNCVKRWGLKIVKPTDIDPKWLRKQKKLGRTDGDIAAELRVSQEIVSRVRSQHRIPRKGKQYVVDRGWLTQQKLLGRSDKDIAEEIGCSTGTIKNRRIEFGITKHFLKNYRKRR